MTSAPANALPGSLYVLFVGVALAGIGGGMPAHIRRVLVERGYLDDATFAENFTLAQMTPGPNAVNLSAMLGMRLGGGMGALACVLGILTPGLAVMLGLSLWLLHPDTEFSPFWQGAMRGAACAAVAVMVSAAIPVWQVSQRVRGGSVLAVLTVLALGVLRVSLLPVLLLVLGIGLWLNRPQHGAPDGAAYD